jgi:hypothetical protein
MRHWVKTLQKPSIWLIFFEQPEPEKESDVNILEKLKLRTKWIAFAETVDTCLNHLKGQEHFQIHYIIQSIVDQDTEQKLIIATTPLLGGPILPG